MVDLQVSFQFSSLFCAFSFKIDHMNFLVFIAKKWLRKIKKWILWSEAITKINCLKKQAADLQAW
mgnify:CR=1 FL=1